MNLFLQTSRLIGLILLPGVIAFCVVDLKLGMSVETNSLLPPSISAALMASAISGFFVLRSIKLGTKNDS